MSRLLYSVALYVALPFVFLRLLWRSRRAPAYRLRWAERLGLVARCNLPDLLWLHAVSFGEVQAAAPLVSKIRALEPQRPLLITTMTPTGSAQVRRLFGDQVLHYYLPYDTPDAVARFLTRVQPVIGIILETELWPNLLHACHQRGMALYWINVRLSPASAAGYAWIAPLARSAMAQFTAIAAQTTEDAQRLQAFGVQRICVTGSLKFDVTVPSALVDRGRALRAAWGTRPVWIAASTHPGEEALILTVHHQLRQRFPDLLLVLVPRHPERFNLVADLCHQHSFHLARRANGSAVNHDTAVYLGDTMGELLLLYAATDIAFIGGSLVPVGGHNPLEPAAVGIATVVGPYTFNFAQITQGLVKCGACWQIENAQQLTPMLTNGLSDARQRAQAGAQGQAFVQAHRGATDKVATLVLTPRST